jgi:hypothetical protein
MHESLDGRLFARSMSLLDNVMLNNPFVQLQLFVKHLTITRLLYALPSTVAKAKHNKTYLCQQLGLDWQAATFGPVT